LPFETQHGDPIVIMGAGSTAIAVGIGIPITHGDGLHFIMVDGACMDPMVGSGYLIRFGGLPG
jgi:hypothetical protein